jgi:hypothetical protein
VNIGRNQRIGMMAAEREEKADKHMLLSIVTRYDSYGWIEGV